MPVKLELHNAAVSITRVGFDEDDRGRIPDNLAKLTETLIGIHKANGDLAWVLDIASDAKKCEYGILPYDLPVEYSENSHLQSETPASDE